MWTTEAFQVVGAVDSTVWDVDVALPDRYGRIEDPTVIVCMDAPWVWGTVRDAIRVMSFSREAPEAIVVGLTGAAETSRDYTNLRARWFTPSPFLPPPETGVRDVDASDCGHGDVTITMISEQLLPELASRYGGGQRWYVGHSFSGLLGLRTLFTRPETFDKWLLASPSIWWDDRSILDSERSWAANNGDLLADVWLSAGELESDFGESYAMISNARELAATLTARDYPGLRVAFAQLGGESHSSTIGAAVSAGLRHLHAWGAAS